MDLQNKLLQWFRKNARPLPWRQKYDPYHVWISEIMLQQTQMETVLPYFKRWTREFSDIRSLAESSEQKVLKAWQGLGYYSRARNLHESAKTILKKFNGRFPSRYEDILSLKGVGRYSAGAIASIAFNEPKPIVDGNVLRVLSRVYAIKKSIDPPKNRESFWKLEEKLIPKGEARAFNQALMELGALVLHKNGKVLIRLRPLGKIMGGLWEFPEWKLARNRPLGLQLVKEKIKTRSGSEFGQTGELKYLGPVKRNYTHHLETLHVFLSDVSGLNGSPEYKTPWKSAWVSLKEFDKYPFSSAHAKIADLLD